MLAPLHDLAVLCRPAATTTTFENVYTAGRRSQRCLTVAERLGPADVPPRWRETARAVLLAPVMNEVDPALAYAFPGALVGVAAQGYLRTRRRDGAAVGRRWQPSRRWLGRLAALVLSGDDLAHAPALISKLSVAPVLVLTHGAAGAQLICGGETVVVPAYPAHEVDATGAGDVFAAALLVALVEGRPPAAAARFAASAASWAVEAPGTEGIATREQIEERLRRCDASSP